MVMLDKPIIIAFGYKKGTGKNTIAKFLSTHINCSCAKLVVKEVSFAAKLKDICYQLYSWAGLKRGIYYESHREEKEQILPKLGVSPRDIWIEVGNKLREVYPGTWIDFALNGVKADVIIITDMGFTNEAKAILEKDGYLIKMVRSGLEQGTDGREVELDSWTQWYMTILNNDSLEDLNESALMLWDKINAIHEVC